MQLNDNLDNLISWHYSPFVFDAPDYELIIENRSDDQRPTHTNSYLGLWSCTFPGKVGIKDNESSLFGMNAYQITYKENVNTKLMKYSDFYRFCVDNFTKEDYIKIRNELIESGYDVLAVIDTFYGGYHLGEIVTLNFDIIDKFEKCEPKYIKDHIYRLNWRSE